MAKYDLRSEFISTNVEGIQSIPKEWSIKQVRYLLKDGAEGIKIGPFGSALKLEDMVDDGFSVYGQENVIKKDFSLGKRKISETKFQEMSVYRVFPKDILITMMGTSGKCEIVPSDINDGIIDSHLLRVRVKEDQILPEFFKLLIDKSPEISYQIQVFGKGSIMHGLNSGIVKSLNLPLPLIEEQKLILNFLDHETAQIDTLIAKQEKLIELLKEKRQAVISHAVTKGLNPDVVMKDSGVEWLGQVPEHWSVCLFKRKVQSIKDGTHGTHQRVDIGELLLSAKNVFNHGIEIGEVESYIPFRDYQEIVRNGFPKKGDILVTCVGTIGRSFVYPYEKSLAFQRSVSFIRLGNKCDPYFYKYFIESTPYQAQLLSLVKSSAQGGVYMGDLINTNVIDCPLVEQLKIVDFVDNEIKKIDGLIFKAQHAIQLMQERRTALISSAVTGKIDVRNWRHPNKHNGANTELGT